MPENTLGLQMYYIGIYIYIHIYGIIRYIRYLRYGIYGMYYIRYRIIDRFETFYKLINLFFGWLIVIKLESLNSLIGTWLILEGGRIQGMDTSWKPIRRPFICAQNWVSTSRGVIRRRKSREPLGLHAKKCQVGQKWEYKRKKCGGGSLWVSYQQFCLFVSHYADISYMFYMVYCYNNRITVPT